MRQEIKGDLSENAEYDAQRSTRNEMKLLS
jgi:transcription elongation GreA/GreB family factor